MNEKGRKNSGGPSRSGSDLHGSLFFLSSKSSARHFDVSPAEMQIGARVFWRGARGFSGGVSQDKEVFHHA